MPDIDGFFRAVLEQDAERLRGFFHTDAYVNWHCTDEHFTAEEYIRANCEYPGEWDGTIERVERAGSTVIMAARVFPKDRSASFHVVTFLLMDGENIRSMDEYWADDGEAPQWRQTMNIGRPIEK